MGQATNVNILLVGQGRQESTSFSWKAILPTSSLWVGNEGDVRPPCIPRTTIAVRVFTMLLQVGGGGIAATGATEGAEEPPGVPQE